MSDKDYIKELFSEKLGNYEAKVNPELWSGIASQIGTAAAVTGTATGLSLVAKWIIGLGIAGVVTVSTIVLVNGNSEETKEQIAEQTLSEEPQNANDDYNRERAISAIDESTETDLNEESQQQTVANDVVNAGTTPINEEGGEREPDNITVADNGNPAQENNGTPPEKNKAENKPSDNGLLPPQIVDPAADQVEFIEEIEQEVKEEASVSYTIEKLPNIITPNGDRVNDNLEIKSTGLTRFSITVLNDQNNVVYQSNDPNFRWNATDMAGGPVPAGNYIYIITANEFESEKPKRYSPLRVVR